MELLTEKLTKAVAKAFEDCGYDGKLGTVGISDRADLCQFQSNGAFEGAKIYKKNPFDIASAVAEKLNGGGIFAKAEAVRPGFINLTLEDDYLISHLSEMELDGNHGVPQIGAGKKVVLDYGGPNVAKPLHIGHLRPAIIGESIKRMLKSAGYDVIADIHMGDWGLPMGLVIAELNVRHPEWRCFAADFNPEKDKLEALSADELNEIYPFASKKSKEDENFRETAKAVTGELQNGHPGYTALWREIVKASVTSFREDYGKLDVSFDLWLGESDADSYIPELVERLEDKNLIYESDGAMVVDVSEDSDRAPMPPVIIKKSDGSSIYATTDLATIIQRQRDYAPDKIWYITDKRQELHFTQVFRCAKKAGLVPAETDLRLCSNGTVNGADGKPYKTRDGGVMRLTELLKMVTESAALKMRDSAFTGDENIEDNIRKVAMSAVKFGDLSNHRSKDYIFDTEKFLSFEGKTGPYILYMVTRINSILRKAGGYDGIAGELKVHSASERQLLLSLALAPEAVIRSLNEVAPNVIAESVYGIASLFSNFYHETNIINETDDSIKCSRLTLCAAVRKNIEFLLSLLGIETVDRM